MIRFKYQEQGELASEAGVQDSSEWETLSAAWDASGRDPRSVEGVHETPADLRVRECCRNYSPMALC